MSPALVANLNAAYNLWDTDKGITSLVFADNFQLVIDDGQVLRWLACLRQNMRSPQQLEENLQLTTALAQILLPLLLLCPNTIDSAQWSL